MSLSIIIIFILFVLIVLPLLFCIKNFNRQRKLALIVLLIPFITLGLVSNFIYNLVYTTTPDSLNIQLIQDVQKFIIDGTWVQKYERYSYGKDFIAISLAKGISIRDSNMQLFEISKEEDNYLLTEVTNVLKKNPNFDSSKQTTIFGLDVEKNFQLEFELDQNVSENDLVVQYIHVYYPPMDHFLYWVKTVNGIVDDPVEMTR